MIKRLILIIIITFFLAACSPGDKIAPPNGAWLDHFDITRSGWNTFRDEYGSVEYDMDGLRFSIDKANTLYWSTLNFWYEDVIVKADAAKLSGVDINNMIGLVCRYQDDNNFYAAAISSDQTYAIFKRVEGGPLETISTALWVFNPAINPGDSVNKMELICKGKILTLKVNGVVLDHAVDSEFASGKVGVLAGSGADGGVDIVFDQFTSRGIPGE